MGALRRPAGAMNRAPQPIIAAQAAMR
jgi:hypothetical protein